MKDRSAVTSDGRVLGIASIARDITERVRADEQARAASQYARSLIEASLDALVTISPEGKITDVNEATVEFPDVARGALERIGVAACKWEISSSGGVDHSVDQRLDVDAVLATALAAATTAGRFHIVAQLLRREGAY
jgi:PAS domain-containing protein